MLQLIKFTVNKIPSLKTKGVIYSISHFDLRGFPQPNRQPVELKRIIYLHVFSFGFFPEDIHFRLQTSMFLKTIRTENVLSDQGTDNLIQRMTLFAKKI